MIQKVKIDLLTDFDEGSVEAIDAIEKDVVADYDLKTTRWYSGRQLLLLLLIGVTSLAFILSVLGTILWMRDQKAKSAARVKKEAEARLAQTESVVNLNDFMINIKDSKGNLRILVCDVALEFAPNRISPDIDKRVDVRNIIYNAAKGRTTDWWQSTEGSHGLKKEINSRLNALLGAEVVKEVHFTKLEVL